MDTEAHPQLPQVIPCKKVKHKPVSLRKKQINLAFFQKFSFLLKSILLLISLFACRAFSMDTIDAVRLLQQGTFGPAPADIEALQIMTPEEWVDQQLELSATLHRSYFPDPSAYSRQNFTRVQSWIKAALHADDQLRQRMAFALSQIFVASEVGTTMKMQQLGLADYYDTLVKGALGNYRDLMYHVTMHPVMGTFLTYSPNWAKSPDSLSGADENYAREILQLMTVGPYLLNQDGTYQLDTQGNRISTYDQSHIAAFAKVFTGLCYAHRCDYRFGDYTRPMVSSLSRHDQTEKQLLLTTLPDNPASVDEDINAALDDIFSHSNVAPFVSSRLIKMLVTSNPSPEYVGRVSAVFNNNGSGVKGDLAAVAKAILLDDEARFGHKGENANYFGKLREPLLKMTHFFRALEIYPKEAQGSPTGGFYNLERNLHQAPLMSPTVFNFYQFDYQHPIFSHLSSATSESNALSTDGFVSPVFQLNPEDKLLNRLNFVYFNVVRRRESYTAYGKLAQIINAAENRQEGVSELVEYLNERLLQGDMSDELRAQCEYVIHRHRQADTIVRPNGTRWRRNRIHDPHAIKDLMMLIYSSAEFAVQR